ncbi:MAG: dihydropteroate synthase [Actinomycetota bacterium]|nr:dihydropteroate synthase [Actinomycetota bacterium]
MGIVNVTPDSFSDGGRWFDHGHAIAHGRELIDQGADIVDVGGESTRPGALPVSEDEELRRVLPVIEALAERTTVSIDTRKPRVAEAAIAAGATIVNDVSSSLFEVAAAGGAGWVAMHSRADPTTMNAHAHYDDVVAEVRDHLVARAEQARAAGVEQVWIDPGIGFAKTAAHNLALLRHLDDLVATGWDVTVGTSRKSFLGPLSARPGQPPAPAAERVEASVATAVWALTQGAAMLRVHDVVAVAAAVRLAAPPAPAARVATSLRP